MTTILEIQERPFGLELRFEGSIQPAVMRRWMARSMPVLSRQTPGFGVLVHVRDTMPLHPEALDALRQGQAVYAIRGMRRSAVILHDGEPEKPWRLLAEESGITSSERYIRAENHADPRAVALRWIETGKEPGASA